MNNSTSCSRKNTFLRISFLFVHVRTQEQKRVQNFFSEPVPVVALDDLQGREEALKKFLKSQTLPTVPVLTGSVFSKFMRNIFKI